MNHYFNLNKNFHGENLSKEARLSTFMDFMLSKLLSKRIGFEKNVEKTNEEDLIKEHKKNPGRADAFII